MSRVGSNFLTSAASFFPWVSRKSRSQEERRVITLLSVGWLPPSLPPSGAGLMRGTSGPVGLLTPPRVTPHRGGVSADGREHLGALGLHTSSHFYACGVTGMCLAMAHRKARTARAMATTTCWAFVPVAIRWRYRVQRRTWAFQLMAWIAGGSFARRRGRCRRIVAGYREAQAPSTRARRA